MGGRVPGGCVASSRSGSPTRGATSGSSRSRISRPARRRRSRRCSSTRRSTRWSSRGRRPRSTLLDRLLHIRQDDARDDTRSTRARSTSSRASTPTAPTRGSPTAASAARASARIRARSPRTGSIGRTSDGDGRVLLMRHARSERLVEDASGRSARCSIARRPDDVEGEFFRVFPEGTIKNWDGVNIPIAPPSRAST